MKNKIIWLIFALVSLFLIGCSDKSDDKVSSKFDDQFEEISQYIEDNIPNVITDDIELVYEYLEYNAYIDWTSSNEELISSYGDVKVDINKAHAVELTYTVVIGDNQKESTINVVVSPLTPEEIAERFAKQFAVLIIRDYVVNTKYYDLFNIEWYSTNQEVFTNEGIYIKPAEDTPFEIKYVVTCGNYSSEEYTKEITAAGVSDYEKFQETEKWVKEIVLNDLYFTIDKLPDKFEKYDIPITWECSNPDVIFEDGTIKHFVFERYVTLTCRYSLENGSSGRYTVECIVSPLDTSKMSEEEIIENFISAIALNTYSGVSFGYSSCPVLSQTYGSLYFYTNTESKITKMIIEPGTSNRSQKPMDPQLVVIHDTANYNASAEANAKYVYSGYSGSTTSWHYTTGNDGIYQTLPENECGAHANGSNSTPFEYIDTGIKATALKPQITIGKDYYVYISGQKTNIMIPDTTKPFADDGVLFEIGKNGNYWISKFYYCDSHKSNGNMGGNASGIGIESAVKYGDDYIKTVRMTSKLTAEILIRHGLNIDRVVQHNTMSGKNCPQAIREANFWYTFKDYVSLEKWAKENLADYQFSWTSNCSEINNEGYIIKQLGNTDEVKYSVVVSKNGKTIYKESFITKLI